MKNILLAGGAGYIGSHTAIELLNSGYGVIIVDNLSNSKKMVIDRIEKISSKKVKFYEFDTRSKDLERVFKENRVDLVVDFAAYKSVGDSVANPLKYYDNNLSSQINMMTIMSKYGVNKFVFSSSATVYGDVRIEDLPAKENYPLSAKNPYGTTKLMGEKIIEDTCKSNKDLNSIILRYFNPIGAHESGLIGEDCKGVPANIMPYLTKVAIGELSHLNVFGNDYRTKDGTGVRDYIHVVDLAKGHLKAIEKLLDTNVGLEYYNLGTGNGYSVFELIDSFSRACGIEIPYVICKRREGDIDMSFADPSKAKKELGWVAEYGIDRMCVDSWRWQKNNPRGYID
nr:UDP-glucose 4-epimerase GalE [uncultured Peptostreptococcus sp.]